MTSRNAPALPEQAAVTPLPSSILREYDIRGVVGETLLPEHAYAIGRGFALSVRAQYHDATRIAVGYDGRLSSPALEAEVVRGITDIGLDAICIGCGPTPMLYHASVTLRADAGIMITGSHNPPSHNGFKMLVRGKPLFGKDIQELGQRAVQPVESTHKGLVERHNIQAAYVDYLVQSYGTGERPLRVVWDAGNGAAGEVMQALAARLPGQHHLLFEQIDGHFPNHHPDPSVPANMQDLIAAVKKHAADIGIAFDGDGDRIGLVDGEGHIWWGDQMMQLLAKDVLAKQPGATIIADVKASQTLFDAIAAMGGKPLMWKTGHSLVKAKMAEIGAPLAGEMSGHIFFAENHGFDDALFAAVRMLKILSHMTASLAEVYHTLPHPHNTPEIRIECEGFDKFRMVQNLQQQLRHQGVAFSDVDGVRARNADGWWLLRASNTQSVLVARCEGKDPAALERLKAGLKQWVEAEGLPVPEELLPVRV